MELIWPGMSGSYTGESSESHIFAIREQRMAADCTDNDCRQVSDEGRTI